MDGSKQHESVTTLRPLDRSRRELVASLELFPEGSKKRKMTERQLELFDAQHDNTGSWKSEYFGRDMREDLKTRGLELGADGKLPVSPEDARTHYMLVNMGELDRINATGDHSSGDIALEETAKGIRAMIGETVNESQFEIYRYAGNDFGVRLIGVDRETAEKITRALCGKVDVTKALNAEDHVPIEASLASQSDIIDVLNKLEPEDLANVMSEERPEGQAIGVTRELLQQQNDRQKIESRMRRMQEVLDQDPGKAKDFYQKYQKKILGELFKNGDKDAPDFEVFRERFVASDNEARSRLAMEEARRQHASRRETQRGLDRTLSELAAKETLGAQSFQEKKQVADVPREAQSEAQFEAPKPTRGFLMIEEKRAIYDSLQKSGADTEDIELAQLDYEIERANRDRLTGLNERGRMFQALESGLEQGKAVGSIYIDMAFLKYFDKEANSETGNVAIKKAAEIIDSIAEEASREGIQVEAYRVGGDEFAFSVVGNDPYAIQKVLAMIVNRQNEATAIPLQGENALGTFYKQKLSFNFGAFGPMDIEASREYLRTNKIPIDAEPGTPEERNQIAELSLRLADKQLEMQKGINRISFLRRMKRQVNGNDNTKYTQLLKYSQKAIFGEAGEKFIEKIADGSPEELLEEITEFVIEQIKIKNQKKDAYETSIDRIIDERAHEMFFEQQINGLKYQLARTQASLEQAQGENTHLKQQVQVLEEEIRNVARIKERILKA